MADAAERRNLSLDALLDEALDAFVARTPESAARHEAARASMPGGNTRTVLHYSPYPLAMARGEGIRVWDLDGHRYTDFLGEYTAGLYGHSNPKIQAAVRRALDEGVVLCAPNRYEAELAALICARFPSCDRVRFTNSGTEGNLMALGAARAFTKRPAIMVFDGAYHGGVLYFAHGPSAVNAPYEVVTGAFNDLERTLALIEANAGRLAAILVEPMQGAGGCIPADREFLQGLREAADRLGIVLVFDEVMTSRLSPGGLQEKLGVVPDLTSFGKYLGGGLTFGAFGGRRDIMDQFDPSKPGALPHAGTFNNNVLTMAAGLTGLRDIYTPELAVSHNARADRFRDALNALAAGRDLPLQFTGVGSIMGVHFSRAQIRNVADTEVEDQRANALLHLELLAQGFYTARRGFMSLSLPLDDDDYAAFGNAVGDFLDTHATVLAGLDG